MFYLLTNNLSYKYKFICKDQALLGFSKNKCDTCGRDIVTMEYDSAVKHRLVVEGGNIYPDILPFCGAGKNLLIMSREAIAVFQSESISGIECYESVDLFVESRDGVLSRVDNAPQYFNITLCGNIDLSYSGMFLKKKNVCNSCGQYEFNRKKIRPFIVDNKTWDNSDLCSIGTFPSHTVCTSNVYEVVRKYGLKGFMFEKLKTCSDTGEGSVS